MQVFATGCTFDTYNLSCPRFSSTFNTFDLVFTPQDKFDSFDARLYNKNNPTNEILIELNGPARQIKNINPFTESGVYVLEVKAYNKGKVSFISNYEYIFDNLQPAPPVVPLNLKSNSNEVLVTGKTQEKNIRVIAEVSGKTSLEVNSNQNSFALNLNNLNSGINYVKFYTISENGLKSFSVERVVVSNVAIENNYEQVSGIAIADLSVNERTYFEPSLNEYYTTKKNFYVTGTAIGSNGAEIYVNGQRAIFDGNKYGVFVLLNLGRNEIVVQSGLHNVTTYVNYVNAEFKFLQFDYDKIFSNDFQIKGNTNLNMPFDIYLNGKYIETNSNYINEGNGIYSFDLDIAEANLKPGKNYIYLVGYNNEYFEDIIYKDTENPVIASMSFENIANNKELVFKITDDIAVEDNNVTLHIGPYTYTSSSNLMRGDFYTFDLSEVLDGTYNYDLSATDVAGKRSTYTGTVNIKDSNTLIEKFSSNNNMYVVGNNLFVKNGAQELRITPSKFIAFKKIYLDGVDQINYEMLSDGTVILNLDFNKSIGKLSFSFINKEHSEFHQEYNYYSDSEKPQVKLDYISNPYTSLNNYTKITGKITDSHFNWSSLKLNNQNNILRFGDYFEAIVIPTSEFTNLQVTGNDYSGNSLNAAYNSILTKDITTTGVDINSISYFISGSFLNSASLSSGLYSSSRMRNYVYNFNGFDVKRTYVQNQFELPLSQRNGIESLNLKGVESSGSLFETRRNINLDSLDPQIYLYYNQTLKKYMVVADGTYSNISIVNISSNNQVLDVSSCNYKPYFYTSCKFIDNITGVSVVNVYAEDMSKNIKYKSFNLSDAIVVSPIIDRTPPQIILNLDSSGNVSPLQVLKDSTYNEPGASCIDNVDMDCNVIITGSVNTAILGNYFLSYFAQDRVGNNMTLIRMVRVVDEVTILTPTDTVAPVIILNSSSVIEVLVNSTFVNPSASCIDNSGSTCIININGSVNTSVLGNYSIVYSANDSSGNSVSVNQTVSVVTNLSQNYVCENKLENIYLSYDRNLTNNNNFIIQGNFIIKCDSVLKIEIVNGLNEIRGSCTIGENSFLCNTLLEEGDNLLKIIITGIDGHKINKSIQIKMDGTNPQILINSITSTAIYKVSNNLYYINDPRLNINLNLSEKALVKIIIDGTENLNLIHDRGNFVLNVNVTNALLGQESKDINLFVEVQDTAGNTGVSSIIELIYNRITQVFAYVSVK